MRLFIAVNFSDETKAQILEVQGQLRSLSLRGSFTRLENLHLTLAFLGETPEEKLPALFQILESGHPRAAGWPPPFEIIFNRTGCFTHSRKELWWIGADRDAPGLPLIETLHSQLLDRLSEAGFSVDIRPFSAHITLGREIKHTDPIILNCPDITVSVDRISLMKSERVRGILTYTELAFHRNLRYIRH